MQRLPFSAHTNRILHTIPVLCRFEQSQFFKLQHKAADRRVSGVPEILFQLLGGKLRVAVSGQNKLPQCFLLLSDLSVGQGGLKRLGRLCGRKHPVQLMIYIFDKIRQKRRCVQHTADGCVLLHQRIGVIIPLAAFVDILGERHEQRRGISLLHQIPQMHQPCHSAVAVKVRMQIRHVEVDQRRFQQIVDLGFFMDKGDKIHIKGSAAELNSMEITGNPHNEELTAFRKELKGLGKPSEKVLEEKAGKFINEHHSSLASIYLLDKYFAQKEKPDYTLIKQLTEHMTGELKDRPYIDGLLDRIQEEEKAATGKTAAYFRLPNAEGKQITRSNFKDQYLLIHFWASWDTVSRDSNAVYRRIYRKGQKNKKFALLGISLDLNKDNWKKAIETDTLKWEQACDLSGWETGVVKQLAIRTLPANVLLSPSGRIEGKNLSETAIEKKLKDIEEQEKKEKKREIENERKKKR